MSFTNKVRANVSLRPCPFCGNKKIGAHLQKGDEGNIGVVGCGKCGGQVRSFESLELAIKIWNGRTDRL